MDFQEYIDNLCDEVSEDLPMKELNDKLYSDILSQVAEADEIIGEKTHEVLSHTFHKLGNLNKLKVYRQITRSYLENLDQKMISCKHDYGNDGKPNPLFLSHYIEKAICTQIKNDYENDNSLSRA